ncbi:MAG: RNA 2',3'-cyclic phosphodiesterase [Pseudobdellovibrionaceae bacterium]
MGPTQTKENASPKKLFIAINATDPLSKSFEPIYKKLKINADKQSISVKWVPLDNFHITLNFLGMQNQNKIPAIEQAMTEACSQLSSFNIKIEDISAYSNEHDARVIWLGVQKKKNFADLKLSLENILLEKKLLLQPDEREFAPHLTIGRLRNARSVKDMISPFKRKSFGKIHVTELVLYESQLRGSYPIYIPLFRCQLSDQVKIADEVP